MLTLEFFSDIILAVALWRWGRLSLKQTTGLLDLDAGRLARSQNPEGPATGHPDTGFLGFPGS